VEKLRLCHANDRVEESVRLPRMIQSLVADWLLKPNRVGLLSGMDLRMVPMYDCLLVSIASDFFVQRTKHEARQSQELSW
jgi:hypothetical protein